MDKAHDLVLRLGLGNDRIISQLKKLVDEGLTVIYDTFSVNDRHPNYHILKKFNGHYPFLLALMINQIDVEHVEYFYQKGFMSNTLRAPIGFDGEDVEIDQVEIFFMALGGYDKDLYDLYSKYFTDTSMNVYVIEFYGKGMNMNDFVDDYVKANGFGKGYFYRHPAKEEVFFHYKFQDQESDTYIYPSFRSARMELDSFIIDSLIPDELDTWRMNRVQLVELIESNGYTPEDGLDRTDLLDIIDENGWVPMLEVKMNNLKETNPEIIVNSRGLLNSKNALGRYHDEDEQKINVYEWFINGVRHNEKNGLDVQNENTMEQNFENWQFGKLVGKDYGNIKYVSPNNYGFGDNDYY